MIVTWKGRSLVASKILVLSLCHIIKKFVNNFFSCDMELFEIFSFCDFLNSIALFRVWNFSSLHHVTNIKNGESCDYAPSRKFQCFQCGSELFIIMVCYKLWKRWSLQWWIMLHTLKFFKLFAVMHNDT